MLFDDWTTAGLWLAVVGSGIYHGINPGMGWPLAVSAGLMGNGRSDLIAALGPLAIGHFLAMAGILLPFGLMTALVAWKYEIQIGAGLLVIAAGIYLLINRRHPRFLARIKPTQLALWSFAVAMAHGAGLMLVPIYLGLCKVEELDAGHQAAFALMGGNLGVAVLVSIIHAAARPSLLNTEGSVDSAAARRNAAGEISAGSSFDGRSGRATVAVDGGTILSVSSPNSARKVSSDSSRACG